MSTDLTNLTDQQRIELLEAELFKLRKLNTINTALEQASVAEQLSDELKQPIVSSPALQDQLSLGQSIAFINNRQDCVPGVITNLNNDGTYDLKVYIPTSKVKVSFNQTKTAFERLQSIELVEHTRPRARWADPRTIFRKQMIALSEQQRGTEGIVQTHIDTFIPQEQKLAIPRFHDFHTSLVGTFFDPSPYLYKVVCWRAEMIVENDKFPEKTLIYPTKKPYYTDFNKCFNRYFKEYHQGMSKAGNKWNRVEIQVFAKESE